LGKSRSITQAGFTLIELLVVLVVIAIVWASVLPMLQTDQQRVARQWLTQAEGYLTLSCDLAAQLQTSHRVLVGNALSIQRWDSVRRDWIMDASVAPLSILPDWKLSGKRQEPLMKEEPLAWTCRADGDQQAGELQLSQSNLGQLRLLWTGDGRYEVR
jgi:prepilin-type N-terminal cleavage/methylation domain-containing protein